MLHLHHGFLNSEWSMVLVCHRPMRTRASRDTSPLAQPRIMQCEQSTPAPGADARATSIEQRTAQQIRSVVSDLEQRITE
jgi:hypothetical protein